MKQLLLSRTAPSAIPPDYDREPAGLPEAGGGGLVAGTFADPAVILPETFETEAAQTDAWDRASPPEGKDGVSVRTQTRTAYDHTSDKKLYAFYRTFIFDSVGLVVSISAETRIEVDAPGACP